MRLLCVAICIVLALAALTVGADRTRLPQSAIGPVDPPITVDRGTDSHTYDGSLQIFVVEPTSTRYRDANNVFYKFGLLNLALNQSVTLGYGDTVRGSTTWNAGVYGPISQNNIKVIAVVSNTEIAYHADSDPDNNPGGEFIAYYTDATAAALPGQTGVDTASGSYTHTVWLIEATQHG